MQFRKLSYCALFCLLLFLIGCGGKKEEGEEAAAPAPSAPAGGGNMYDASKATASISGKITFEGQKPTLAKLPLTPECIQAHGGPAMEETVEVNDNNTLKDVFVYVKEGADKWTYPTPTEPVVMDQKGCHYVPHVFAVMANQPLQILNSDPFLHNVHPQPTAAGNEPFNQGMPVKGMKIEHKFPTPEIMVPVKCDVHRWMQAYIAVVKNPFYSVSGADGSFAIKLPAGTYTIEAWHEKYGTQTQQVTVADNETKEITFTFKAS